jgi:hypothetical protein
MNQRPSRALCLWPGLAGLWLGGHWGSLFVALAFSLLLNAALANSFLWPQLLGSTFGWIAWPCLFVAWCLAFWSARQLPEMAEKSPNPSRETDDTLFILAQTEYLKGNWEACCRVLEDLLRTDPRDLESRLLLATVFRRTGRKSEAREQLATFRKFDGSQQWMFEVQRELRLLDEPAVSSEGASPQPDADLDQNTTPARRAA